MGERVILVNEFDEIIGSKERCDICPKDINRISAMWITNPQGQILLSKRAKTKKYNPGKWGTAVAGTVNEGETYQQNIIKEAYEEIGLKNITPIQGPKIKIHTNNQLFIQWFVLITNKNLDDLTIQKEEIDQVKWWTKNELRKELYIHPENFSTSINEYVKQFI